MMRKFLLICTLLLLLICAAACDGGESGEPVSSETGAETTAAFTTEGDTETSAIPDPPDEPETPQDDWTHRY